MRNSVPTLLLMVYLLAASGHARADSYVLRPLHAHIILYSHLLRKDLKQIASDRAKLRAFAGKSGNIARRRRLLTQIAYDLHQIGQIKAGANVYVRPVWLRPHSLAAGQEGIFHYSSNGALSQILSHTRALGYLSWVFPSRGMDSSGNPTGGYTRDTRLVCFSGFDFSHYAAGSGVITICGFCRISTYSYKTVTGAVNTVLSIEPLKFVDDVRQKPKKK